MRNSERPAGTFQKLRLSKGNAGECDADERENIDVKDSIKRIFTRRRAVQRRREIIDRLLKPHTICWRVG